MSDDKKILFSESEVLVYSSDSKAEKYEILKIVDGQYSDSKSGTCGKPKFDVYDYQVVYLRPIDSLNAHYSFIGERSDDCQRYPKLTEKKLIGSINGSYNETSSDRIMWLNEFEDQITNFKKQHKTLTIRDQTYDNVLEYDVTQGTRLSKLYYTRKFGFVGYQLKDGTVFVLVM